MRRRFCLLVGVLLLVSVGAGVRALGPDEPVLAPYRWSDTLTDETGLSWLENSLQRNGEVTLSNRSGLGDAVQGGEILALTIGPDGRVYMGTDGAYLNVYDPVTGIIEGLGAPVPSECFT